MIYDHNKPDDLCIVHKLPTRKWWGDDGSGPLWSCEKCDNE